MKKPILFGMVVMILFTSCTAEKHADINSDIITCGFWSGLWHGFISPVTFVISLFSDSVTVWETHNNGGWYTLGFLLGVSSSIGGSTKASSNN